jgi:hypothetical protein
MPLPFTIIKYEIEKGKQKEGDEGRGGKVGKNFPFWELIY